MISCSCQRRLKLLYHRLLLRLLLFQLVDVVIILSIQSLLIFQMLRFHFLGYTTRVELGSDEVRYAKCSYCFAQAVTSASIYLLLLLRSIVLVKIILLVSIGIVLVILGCRCK